MKEQTLEETPRLAWIKDARRRGEAIERESERIKNLLRHPKEVVTADKSSD